MTQRESGYDIRTLADLRSDISITRHFAYFQTASHGPVPDSTQRFASEMMQHECIWGLARGGPVRNQEFGLRCDQARKVLADFLGAGEDEVAWTYNTSTGTRLAVRSLDWTEGDKLAISDVEHQSTRRMARTMEALVGTETTVIPSGDGPTYSPDEFLENLDRHLTPDHQMLIMSHVANTDGRRLAVQEACRIARERGVVTVIDGAQALGVFPVNVRDTGADFYAGSAHKWLLGPAGVGFLVIRRERLPQYNPYWRPVAHENRLGELVTDPSAGRLTEIGTPSVVPHLAAVLNIEMFQRIGLHQIETHVQQLTRRLREGLSHISGMQIASPLSWEVSTGITSIQFPGRTPEQGNQMVARLRDEFNICVKYRPEIEAIRIGVAAFNSAAEVDRLLEVLSDLVPDM